MLIIACDILLLLLQMAEGELKELRAKLQQQQKQFENYREECKNLENFLQAEANKKQAQVRKLKEEAINKDRQFKALKAENTALLAEISSLKNQLGKASSGLQKSDETSKKLAQTACQYEQLKEKYSKLEIELQQAHKTRQESQQNLKISRQKINQLQAIINSKQIVINNLEERISEYDTKIKNQKETIEQLQNRKVKFEQLPTSHKEIKEQRFMTAKKSRRRQQSELEDERIKKFQDKILRYQRQIKELKAKLGVNPQSSPKHLKEENQYHQKITKVYLACNIVTKQYYLSPIVEVNDESKSIKLFKSSRNGCFDKSLGASRHKFDIISHESTQIAKQIVEKIIRSEEELNHSILIYGVKKSNKRQIMASILTKLFNFLKNKVEAQTSQDLQAIFIKKTPDQECSLVKEVAFCSDEILDLLQKAANIATPTSPQSKKGDKSPKKVQKPRVCYFSLRVGDFSIEIGTSSFTNIPYRQNEVLSTFYSNVLYSKLPDILQPAHAQRFIILTLNPIVDLYEQCKNTLSVTLYKGILPSNKDSQLNLEGINKEILNDMVRRKMESYEREIEQNLLKIKKVQEQCSYFKSKFDELESRLKNLLSTHHGQNSYLKKSPILLSYQKMLKFVHAVQAKSPIPVDNICSTLRINEINFDFNDSSDQNEAL